MFDKKEDIVTCHECKLLLSRSDAQKIIVKELLKTDAFRYFCPKDKQVYSVVVLRGFLRKEAYYKEFEVSKDGEPIGYKKISKD